MVIATKFYESQKRAPVRPPMMRRLKSSLKLAKSHSTPSVTTTSSSSSSQKNVRFAAELTTVKKFDSSAEPISISNENSPKFYPISDSELQHNIAYPETLYDNEEDGFWFNESSLMPSLQGLNDVRRLRKFNSGRKSFSRSKFQLDYDSDSGLDDDHYDDEFEEDEFEQDNAKLGDHMGSWGQENKVLEVIDWRLIKTNVCSLQPCWNPFLSMNGKTGDLEQQISDYLQGSNIRLHSLKQSGTGFGKIVGLIYVNNLNFEKFIEIKLTFNSWKDIHYIPANFSKSITSKFDEFEFVIDLNSLKYSLQVKNLIYSLPGSLTNVCPINVELCCRYDVNNETFYDNNNYENYQIQLAATTRNTTPLRASTSVEKENIPLTITETKPSPKSRSFTNDFLVSTTLTHKTNFKGLSSNSRQFSDDTDYYNTSPLKHLYHNDTSLIKPVRMNQVLMNPEISTDDEDYTTPDLADITSKDLILSTKPIESRNSSSSFSSSSSGGYSPLEDFASLASSDYKPYPSIDSMSSMEMANYNYHLPIFNTLHAYNEIHDDGQSIVTDIPADRNSSNNHTANSSNSTDTLINPDAIPRPLSSGSAESASLINSHHADSSNPASNSDSQNLTLEPDSRDQDYQAFLSSYCFHSSPTSKGFDPFSAKTFFSTRKTQPVDIASCDLLNLDNDKNDHDVRLTTPPPVLSQFTFQCLSPRQ